MIISGWITAALLLDYYGRRQPRPRGRWDAIVVAGCGVTADGRPRLRLKRRTRRAVELWRAGLASTIFFTGGSARTGHSEAEVAARFARRLGLGDDAMGLERCSTSTVENARFAREALGPARVIVVTDSYHALRARWVFGRYFDELALVSSELPWWPRLHGALREVVALLHFTLLGRHALSADG